MIDVKSINLFCPAMTANEFMNPSEDQRYVDDVPTSQFVKADYVVSHANGIDVSAASNGYISLYNPESSHRSVVSTRRVENPMPKHGENVIKMRVNGILQDGSFWLANMGTGSHTFVIYTPLVVFVSLRLGRIFIFDYGTLFDPIRNLHAGSLTEAEGLIATADIIGTFAQNSQLVYELIVVQSQTSSNIQTLRVGLTINGNLVSSIPAIRGPFGGNYGGVYVNTAFNTWSPGFTVPSATEGFNPYMKIMELDVVS